MPSCRRSWAVSVAARQAQTRLSNQPRKTMMPPSWNHGSPMRNCNATRCQPTLPRILPSDDPATQSCARNERARQSANFSGGTPGLCSACVVLTSIRRIITSDRISAAKMSSTWNKLGTEPRTKAQSPARSPRTRPLEQERALSSPGRAGKSDAGQRGAGPPPQLAVIWPDRWQRTLPRVAFWLDQSVTGRTYTR